jgi:rare lipoprotein A
MTAAHKSLPLSSYAEVKNLKNNRSVIVKINDRGPFHSRRAMDLSYAAAKELGMGGTTEIQITPLDSNQALADSSSPKTNL